MLLRDGIDYVAPRDVVGRQCFFDLLDVVLLRLVVAAGLVFVGRATSYNFVPLLVLLLYFVTARADDYWASASSAFTCPSDFLLPYFPDFLRGARDFIVGELRRPPDDIHRAFLAVFGRCRGE